MLDWEGGDGWAWIMASHGIMGLRLLGQGGGLGQYVLNGYFLLCPLLAYKRINLPPACSSAYDPTYFSFKTTVLFAHTHFLGGHWGRIWQIGFSQSWSWMSPELQASKLKPVSGSLLQYFRASLQQMGTVEFLRLSLVGTFCCSHCQVSAQAKTKSFHATVTFLIANLQFSTTPFQ